jgi:TorA maturation chaperone TorD
MQDHTTSSGREESSTNTPAAGREFGDVRDVPGFHARRGALYGFAATAFQFPDEDALGDCRDPDVRDAVLDAAEAIAARADGLGADADDVPLQLAACCERFADADEDAIESAYNDLFGLPSDDGSYPVVPYEANYAAGGDVSEIQRRVATVVGLLERFDLESHDEFDERQDHVAVLLELAQVLAAQRAVALDEGDLDAAERVASAEATVLDEHLAGFVPALAHDIADAVGDGDSLADTTLVADAPAAYVAAARFAAALVTWDYAVHPGPDVDASAASGGDRA